MLDEKKETVHRSEWWNREKKTTKDSIWAFYLKETNHIANAVVENVAQHHIASIQIV